jgi:hypothetical protein
MTFADSVLHLVRAGARIHPSVGRAVGDLPECPAAVQIGAFTGDVSSSEASVAPSDRFEGALRPDTELAAEVNQNLQEYEPGLADLEAAVGLVSAGFATRVVLSGFPSWPGLLWRAYQLADAGDVLILPTVVRPGGKVDVTVTRDIALHG